MPNGPTVRWVQIPLVRPLFQPAKLVAGKIPKTLVSDGAANFHEAYTKEFHTMKLETRTEHIRHIRFAGDFNNNKMERMNGEIRDALLILSHFGRERTQDSKFRRSQSLILTSPFFNTISFLRATNTRRSPLFNFINRRTDLGTVT